MQKTFLLPLRFLIFFFFFFLRLLPLFPFYKFFDSSTLSECRAKSSLRHAALRSRGSGEETRTRRRERTSTMLAECARNIKFPSSSSPLSLRVYRRSIGQIVHRPHRSNNTSKARDDVFLARCFHSFSRRLCGLFFVVLRSRAIRLFTLQPSRKRLFSKKKNIFSSCCLRKPRRARKRGFFVCENIVEGRKKTAFQY